MPHLQIKMLKGESEEQKKKLSEALVKAAQSVIGHRDQSYSVTIEEFGWEQWKSEVYPKDIMGRKDILYKEPKYDLD